MQPSAGDYGTSSDDVQLVPSALIAYRHFYMYMGEPDISPGTSWNALHSMNHGIAYPAQNTPHQARCTKTTFTALRFGTKGVTTAPQHGDSPDPHCQCGFYAHYDPDGDFYQGQTWDVRPIKTVKQRNDYSFDFWAAHDRDLGVPRPPLVTRGDDYEGFIPVRAVVELSGRIVVGALGVRAAKMKILAIAVDWQKHYPVYNYYSTPHTPNYLHVIDTSSLYLEPMKRGVDPDVRAAVLSKSHSVAANYGVKAYETAADMNADYPKPDLSALGIEKPRSRTEDYYRHVMSGLQSFSNYSFTASFQAANTATSNFYKTLMGVLDSLDGGKQTPAPPAGTTYGPLTRKEALLEAKKNRPAPPGATNYRKRGL